MPRATRRFSLVRRLSVFFATVPVQSATQMSLARNGFAVAAEAARVCW
jgi:hypothetical protein